MQPETGDKQIPGASEGPPLLEVRNLHVSLGGDAILNDINLKVMPGSIHALIGPNGAGKTTLIRSVMGGMPHQGDIRFYFRNGGRLGYVPQLLEFDHSVPITVGDFIAIMLQDAPVFMRGTKKIRWRVKKVLAATETEHLIDRLIGGLSGGEFRRVLLAQALTPLPELLLLDEPASNVDERGARLIEQMLLRLRKENGLATLLVGHDLAMIKRVADQVTSINREVVFQGSPEALRRSEKELGLHGLPAETKGERNGDVR
jgi:zinc transport system ATP-binding protein